MSKRLKVERPPFIRVDESLIIEGDSSFVLPRLADRSVQMIVTSPPYWGLRDYGIDGQVGLEQSLDQFINRLVSLFAEARRILRNDGTFWLNIGDGYTSGNRGWRAPDKKNRGRAMDMRPETPKGLKPKDLIGVPWRLAIALQNDGWYLRSEIIWSKPNCQPESVKDRPTRAHEHIFMFSKEENYYYDHESVRESTKDGRGTRNRRSVWEVNTRPFAGGHFAVFPPELIDPCIKAGSRPGDLVLDPFFGSGTVGEVCQNLERRYVGIELHPEYVKMAASRLNANEDRILRIGGTAA